MVDPLVRIARGLAFLMLVTAVLVVGQAALDWIAADGGRIVVGFYLAVAAGTVWLAYEIGGELR